MIAQFKEGAVLRKYDGGFFKLIRYTKCCDETTECDSFDKCGGYGLEARQLFALKDSKPKLFCPIIGNGTATFVEMQRKSKKRFVILGEGWLIEEVQDNKKRNRRSSL